MTEGIEPTISETNTRAPGRDVEGVFSANLLSERSLEEGSNAERAVLQAATIEMLKQSVAFEKDKTELQRKAVKNSRIREGVSFSLNVLLGVALACMAPLKTVVPILTIVDKNTGYTETRMPLQEHTTSYPEAVNSHFIAQYVAARESYEWYMATPNFNVVKTMSAPGQVFNAYDVFVHSDKAPIKVLAQDAKLDVRIIAITYLPNDVAQIRFQKTVLGQDGRPSNTIPSTTWIATLTFDYPDGLKMKPEERLINPLGMIITSYGAVLENLRG